LNGSVSGDAIYVEKHIVKTNEYGLINLEIGNGTAISGKMDTIDWAVAQYFIQIEMAVDEVTYQLMGTTQLLSVPYALYAKTAGNCPPGEKGDAGVAGIQGTQGAKGDKGMKGDKGDKGDQGIQGVKGVPGNVSVSYTKIINDTLFVTLSDSTKINAGYVKGAKGDQGIQGVKGDTGIIGPKGDKGDKGNVGPMGPKGNVQTYGVNGTGMEELISSTFIKIPGLELIINLTDTATLNIFSTGDLQNPSSSRNGNDPMDVIIQIFKNGSAIPTIYQSRSMDSNDIWAIVNILTLPPGKYTIDVRGKNISKDYGSINAGKINSSSSLIIQVFY